MKKFKLIRQRTWFSDASPLTPETRTYCTEILANRCSENYKETIITNEEIGKIYGYKLNDVIKTLESVTFFKDDTDETIKLMTGDPYYQVLDDNDQIIFKHNCKLH